MNVTLAPSYKYLLLALLPSMHVISVWASPVKACPGTTVNVTITVQPDYFDIGNYDVRIYGRSNYSGPWTFITAKTGWTNPLGGAFTISAQVTIPSGVSNYTIGAKDYSEENNTEPTASVTIIPPIITLGSASASPLSGQAPLRVTFSYTGGSNISDVEWDFGDGSTGRGMNVSHTYTRRGGYNVYATAIGTCGERGRSTYAGYISVLDTNCYNPSGADGSYTCSGTTRLRCDAGTWVVYERDSPQCGYVPPVQNCQNPYGAPGSYNCQGTTRVQCNNGVWTPIEYNSTQCGYVPPVQGCTNPTGTTGQTRCEGTTKMRCNGTTWVVEQQNSPDCGYAPPGSTGCTNPTGVEGATRCSGTTLMKCQNGTWIAQEYNSAQCGYVPPYVPPTGGCTNPTGNNGDVYCDGYTLKKCQNGTWITQEYNSATCGYGPTPTGCTNPTGYAGDTYCDGTTLKRCNGTSWVVKETNSVSCGYAGSTGGSNTLLYVGVGLAAAIGIGYLIKTRRESKGE